MIGEITGDMKAWIKTKWQSLPQWKQILSVSIILLVFSILDIKFLGLLNDISEGGQGIALILIALTAAPFAIWRMTITNEQKETDKQRLYTDSYIHAVEQLGAVKDNDPNLEVRTGGIYGLGKIARESENHHQEIIELLCAYIRENAQHHPKDEDRKKKPPRMDIQAALDVIGRRDTKLGKPDFRYNLSRVEIQNANLSDLHFEKFNFESAHLEGARLIGAHLKEAKLISAHLGGAFLNRADLGGARLDWANLEKANLGEAHLQGANLWKAHLARANLYKAHLEGAHLHMAHLEMAHLHMAHLEGADCWSAHLVGANLFMADFEGASIDWIDLQEANLTGAKMEKAKSSILTGFIQQQIDQAFGDEATTLPPSLTRPQHWPTRELNFEESDQEWRKWLEDKEDYQPPE